jgi:hypothetical protein
MPVASLAREDVLGAVARALGPWDVLGPASKAGHRQSVNEKDLKDLKRPDKYLKNTWYVNLHAAETATSADGLND